MGVLTGGDHQSLQRRFCGEESQRRQSFVVGGFVSCPQEAGAEAVDDGGNGGRHIRCNDHEGRGDQ